MLNWRVNDLTLDMQNKNEKKEQRMNNDIKEYGANGLAHGGTQFQ